MLSFTLLTPLYSTLHIFSSDIAWHRSRARSTHSGSQTETASRKHSAETGLHSTTYSHNHTTTRCQSYLISFHPIPSHLSDSQCRFSIISFSMTPCCSFYYWIWQISKYLCLFSAPPSIPLPPPSLTPSSPLFMLQLLERYEKKLLSMTAESTAAQRQSASADARIGDSNHSPLSLIHFFLSFILTYSFSPLSPTLPLPLPLPVAQYLCDIQFMLQYD